MMFLSYQHPKNRLRGLLFVLFSLLATTTSSAQFTTVINNGESGNRVDIVFVGDGYRASEIESTYASDVNDTVDFFFNSSINPFPRYKNFFNVHRVNVVSNESGADDPNNGIEVDTALDASYNIGGTDRCLYFNTGKANTAVANALSGTSIDIDMRLGAVNSAKYGGCGGSWAVWSAANAQAQGISVHEIGHSFAGLADEYYFSGSVYTGVEPGEVNVTADINSGKWDRWVGYEDPETNIGEIGYYEGGRYNEEGIWRPSQNSMMRSLNRPFDAISRERLIQEIYEEVDPLDDFLSAGTYLSGDTLWVETVDESVFNVEWFVDGVSRGVLGESVAIDSLGLATGNYNVEARAYDAILDYSNTGSALDWWRLADTSSLQQSANWSIQVTAVPEPSAVLPLAIACVIRRRRVQTANVS